MGSNVSGVRIPSLPPVRHQKRTPRGVLFLLFTDVFAGFEGFLCVLVGRVVAFKSGFFNFGRELDAVTAGALEFGVCIIIFLGDAFAKNIDLVISKIKVGSDGATRFNVGYFIE